MPKKLTPGASSSSQPIAFGNRYKLEDKILAAITDMGDVADLSGCSDRLLGILEECNFSDPHFLGGPNVFHYTETADEVNEAFDKIDAVIAELSPMVTSQGVKEAAEKVAREGRQWMLKQISRSTRANRSNP